MEMTCNRCHQTVQTDTCYCPACGLPQLLYSAENPTGQAQPERWNEAVRDAGSVDWKPALKAAMMLAIPAGLLSNGLSPVNIFGLFWMALAAALAVVLYMRSQRPSWITVGAGARIGLVTGLLGGWTAAGATGASLFAMRFFFHQGKTIDDTWLSMVNQIMAQESAAAGADAQTVLLLRTWMLRPEGRASFMLVGMVFLVAMLIVFAVAGGAIGSRLLAGSRRPEV